jgi:putative transposase
MVWTDITRAQHARHHLRYASDLTEAEWHLIAPCLPGPCHKGRPRQVSLRVILEAILYLLATGCQWRALPREFPPRSTVQTYFYAWRNTGLWPAISTKLLAQARQTLGGPAQPRAGIIDSQSAPTTQSGGPRGLDPAKRIKGRKRHIVTDTHGFLLAALVHPANIQDCHGAVPLLTALRQHWPALEHVYADRVYRGPQRLKALAPTGSWRIDIVKRPTGVKGFQLLPRRWVVERSFAWLGRCRRLAKDFEASCETEAAWLWIANIRIILRKIARNQQMR